MSKHSLYYEAWSDLYEWGVASTARLQRRFKISYGNASTIIDQLRADGVVEPFNGQRPSKILKSPPNSSHQ